MSADSQTLADRVERLEAELGHIRVENSTLRTQFARERRRLRVQTIFAMVVVVAAILISPGSRSALAQAAFNLAARVTALESEVAALQNKTQYVSVASGEMFITGTNLHIVNGLGATNGNPASPYDDEAGNTTVNGKGNLIIGYNESRTPYGETDDHSGSHNLIMGDTQNYSSYGELLAGVYNTATAPYASATGGQLNIVSGECSSVTGGWGNTASGTFASVSGGGILTQPYLTGWSGGGFHTP